MKYNSLLLNLLMYSFFILTHWNGIQEAKKSWQRVSYISEQEIPIVIFISLKKNLFISYILKPFWFIQEYNLKSNMHQIIKQ